MVNSKEIERLEKEANREDINIPERLSLIYRIYQLRGIHNPYLDEVYAK